MSHLFPSLSLSFLATPPPPSGHQEKPNLLCFHPQASSLLASAGFDCQLFLWDLEERTISLRMDPLPQPVSALECVNSKFTSAYKVTMATVRTHTCIYTPLNSNNIIQVHTKLATMATVRIHMCIANTCAELSIWKISVLCSSCPLITQHSFMCAAVCHELESGRQVPSHHCY